MVFWKATDRASTLELSVVRIGLETYRRYESITKHKSLPSAALLAGSAVVSRTTLSGEKTRACALPSDTASLSLSLSLVRHLSARARGRLGRASAL